MIRYFLNIFLLMISLSWYAHAEDPFSRSFTTPIVGSANDTLGYEGMDNPEDAVHPMMRYPIERYIVQGVVISNEGSIAIVSPPGSISPEILFIGDPLGNDMHTIKNITNDFIIAGKNNGEDVSLSVSNPIIMDSLN